MTPVAVSTTPVGNGDDDTPHQVARCGRCGRRFPYTDSAGSAAGRFCEPCRAAMWSDEHHPVSGSVE